VSDHILESIGLSKDQVQKAFGQGPSEKITIEKKNYLFAADQRRIRRRLKRHKGFILARFAEGYKPKQIAGMLNVSEESIRSRLRQADLFGRGKRAGRPKRKSSKQSCLNDAFSAQAHASLVETICLNQSPEM
jgi:hypothetical protein